jgi:DNA polymerase-4
MPMSALHTRPQHDPWHAVLVFDQFSAQVIAAYDPPLRNTAFVVVQQSADSMHTFVRASSTAALNLGIHAGMPVMRVRKQHPSVPVIAQNTTYENDVCAQLSSILESYTPEFHVSQWGTCLLDLTATPSQRQQFQHVAIDHLRNDITRKVGLRTISAGAARTTLLARMLAHMAVPDNTRICRPEDEASVFSRLDTALLPGLSATCREKLRKYGLHTVSQIQALSKEALMCRLGHEGERLYCMAHGIESRSVRGPVLELSAETVLDRDINDVEALHNHVRFTVDKLCHQLKTQHVLADRVHFLLRYTDGKSRQKTTVFHSPTSDYLTICGIAERLFDALCDRRVAVKSMRLTTRRPEEESGQLDLFTTERQLKQERLSAGIVNVRSRMPFTSIVSAAQAKCGVVEKRRCGVME